jgi:hypothetical protein
MAWIDDITERIAATHGLAPDALRLTPGDAETLLDLAGIAAHSTGERTNAPLLCHVLGRARALGVDLDALAATVRATAG